MKSLKLILAATIFSLALSTSSYAGDIGGPANPGPPPPATCSTCDQQESTASVEPTELSSSDVAYEPVQTSELAVEILLALLFVF